jgi:2-polyprenyl-3-methyl-5-hydroxy-6-metoxy-1,4-benzoquinol methylase
MLPSGLAAPYTAMLVDRHSRRSVLVWTSAVRTVSLASAAAAAAAGTPLGVVLLFAAVFTIANTAHRHHERQRNRPGPSLPVGIEREQDREGPVPERCRGPGDLDPRQIAVPERRAQQLHGWARMLSRRRNRSGPTLRPPMQQETVQRGQPEGVPPLELTGERTLPDVPVENYWFRRHLVVYEWIAERCAGLKVVDMACGEGYGTEVLARRAREVTGVDANPETFEHARLKYTRPGVRFVRNMIELHSEPCDAVVLLQTIEHVPDPEGVLRHFREMAGTVYVSTPNLLTLAPAGAGKSGNPWHLREYRVAEFRELCERVFERVELYGLFHARKLRAHELALRAGWDRVHAALGITEAFYDRFTPAIRTRDFALRRDGLERALDFVAVLR